MRMVTLSIPVAVLALCLTAARLPAQQPGSGNFQWYIGGQGGILNFETIEGRHTVPSGGAHMLITASRLHPCHDLVDETASEPDLRRGGDALQ